MKKLLKLLAILDLSAVVSVKLIACKSKSSILLNQRKNFAIWCNTNKKITNLAIDVNNNLYFWTFQGEVYKINDTNSFKTVSGIKDLLEGLLSNDSKNFYVATNILNPNDKFIVSNNKKIDESLFLFSYVSGQITNLVINNNDKIIYFFNSDGFFCKNNNTQESQLLINFADFDSIIFKNNITSSTFVSFDDFIYIGTKNGDIYRIFKSSNILIQKIGNITGSVLSLAVDNMGNIYAGSSNGKVYKSSSGNDFQPLLGTSGAILSLTIDKFGNVYAGSSNGGLYQSDDQVKFDLIIKRDSEILSLVTDNLGHLYFVNSDGTIYKS